MTTSGVAALTGGRSIAVCTTRGGVAGMMARFGSAISYSITCALCLALCTPIERSTLGGRGVSYPYPSNLSSERMIAGGRSSSPSRPQSLLGVWCILGVRPGGMPKPGAHSPVGSSFWSTAAYFTRTCFAFSFAGGDAMRDCSRVAMSRDWRTSWSRRACCCSMISLRLARSSKALLSRSSLSSSSLFFCRRNMSVLGTFAACLGEGPEARMGRSCIGWRRTGRSSTSQESTARFLHAPMFLISDVSPITSLNSSSDVSTAIDSVLDLPPRAPRSSESEGGNARACDGVVCWLSCP
mmetsp:Transcript_64672/g.159170  ORF Transcript_64672/g.159170 Transcript_64672/m.159170 type:complete len:296 (-) Transcript_64672:101-988(-)